MSSDVKPDSVLLSDFRFWAIANSVSLDDEDDWRTWWKCFLAGADAERLRSAENPDDLDS
jgi:hypothetical protein